MIRLQFHGFLLNLLTAKWLGRRWNPTSKYTRPSPDKETSGFNTLAISLDLIPSTGIWESRFDSNHGPGYDKDTLKTDNSWSFECVQHLVKC